MILETRKKLLKKIYKSNGAIEGPRRAVTHEIESFVSKEMPLLWRQWKKEERVLITHEIESFVSEEMPMLGREWKEEERMFKLKDPY